MRGKARAPVLEEEKRMKEGEVEPDWTLRGEQA
jgi:hypothetical protein